MGEELDENDPVRNINGELNGEDLLHSHYTLPGQSGGTFKLFLLIPHDHNALFKPLHIISVLALCTFLRHLMNVLFVMNCKI